MGEGAAALTGNGVGVRVGAGVDAELKEKPGLVDVGVAPGALRSMGLMLGVDGMAGTGAWTLPSAKEGNGELRAGGEDDGTMGGTTGDGGVENCAGGKAGTGSELGIAGGTVDGDVTVTVMVEIMKTVWMPFVPVVVKVDKLPGAAGIGVFAGTGAGVIVLLRLTLDVVVGREGGDNADVLVGTIPPKLNVAGTD